MASTFRSAFFLFIAMCWPISGKSEPVPLWDDGRQGATKTYYDSGAKLPWDRILGDWRDAQGEPWGLKPYGTVILTPSSQGQFISVDVTELVRQWHLQLVPNNGFYILLSKGNIRASSREASKNVPRLRISMSNKERELTAGRDTSLSKSTSKSLGNSDSLQIGPKKPALIWFSLSGLPKGQRVESAHLELYISKIFGKGTFPLNVFRVDPAPKSSVVADYQTGISSGFIFDEGIDQHPGVYFSTGFEERNWQQHWLVGGRSGKVGNHTDSPGYQQLMGRSLAAVIPHKKRLALDIRYRFSQNDFSEPEEAYFRYYLRLGNDWNQTVVGGKLPGFAGTYKTAGWGGRKPNGSNGWSARGSFLKSLPPEGPAGKILTPIGNYVYHLDQKNQYGSIWTWSQGGGPLLENNRWYCVEQYIKLNDPDGNNGIVRAWLDGRKVFEKTGLRFRTTSILKIQDVWFNIYHGGTARSPRDQTTFIDNVVIAREYIGPLSGKNK